jgi:hypothetical protein
LLNDSTDLVVLSGYTNSNRDGSIGNILTGKDLKLRVVPTTLPFGSTFMSQKTDSDSNKDCNADENSMTDSFIKLMSGLITFTGLDAGILLPGTVEMRDHKCWPHYVLEGNCPSME